MGLAFFEEKRGVESMGLAFFEEKRGVEPRE
jgi:hypothetical protein